MSGPNSRPMPDDFVANARVMPRFALAKLYSTSNRTISRWMLESGVLPRKRASPVNCKPVPDDFKTVALGMTKADLGRLYNAAPDTVARWLRLTGIKPATYIPALPPRGGFNLTPTLGRAGKMRPERVTTIYDDAADKLRRKAPVYRCNPKGAFDPKGDHWRMGWSVLTGDELLARAAS